jgi:hypothetical protein
MNVFHLGYNVVEEIPYPDDEDDKANWTPYVFVHFIMMMAACN